MAYELLIILGLVLVNGVLAGAEIAAGPEGMDSGGLPLRLYVKKGTQPERVVRQAKSYSSGPPQQTYVIKGVVRTNRQMIAEVVERAD